MQVKSMRDGFSNTMSGKMNARSSLNTKKILDLDDFNNQILHNDILQGKTLKKQLTEFDINLKKTNPNGIGYNFQNNSLLRTSYPIENLSSDVSKTNSKFISSKEKQKQYLFISCQGLNIQPASQGEKIRDCCQRVHIATPIEFKDKHSIISALFKKGQLKEGMPIQIKAIKSQTKQSQKILQLQNNQKKPLPKVINPKPSTQHSKKQKTDEQISQQIIESISQNYQNQSFQKISGIQQSQIKQSIIPSSAVKSIRQSIQQQIPQISYKSIKSKTKNEIKYDGSSNKSKPGIQQQIYQQVFEDLSIQTSQLKNKINIKSIQKQQDKLQISLGSISKGFRSKTNLAVKSIKFAQQISLQNQLKYLDKNILGKFQSGDHLATQIVKEKNYIAKLQQKISVILNSQRTSSRRGQINKNLDLLHYFKIQINRLITSQNFMSKLRKLIAFLGHGQSDGKSGESISKLQDKLLANIMERVDGLRVSGVTQQQFTRMKRQYDEKLKYELKDQELKLRVQFEQKLFQKDIQLKKMVAQLQKKFNEQNYLNKISNNQKIQKQSTYNQIQASNQYSITSDDIQWKVDLWDILPDYQKKKLYQTQSGAVAKFLTDVLFKEIKMENLERSADISFQFPEQYQLQDDLKSTVHSKKKMFDSQQIKNQQTNKNIPQKQELFPPLQGVKSKGDIQPFTDDIVFNKQESSKKRNTTSVSQVVKILSAYKNLFLKKKNILVRKLIQILQKKHKQSQPLICLINQLRVLSKQQIKNQNDLPFVMAYEQELIMELVSIYNRMKNRKSSTIEKQMKKMYDRLVIACQVKTAQSSIGSHYQIVPKEAYINLRLNKQDQKLKDEVVNQIFNILAGQFAADVPRKKNNW